MSQIKILDKFYKVKPHWFWKQYSQEAWEPETLEIYKKYINPETTYIDLGAWLGVTLMYAHALGCTKLYGVEANPESFELLQEHCIMNGIEAHLDNICICNENKLVDFGADINYTSTSSASSMRGTQFRVQGIKAEEYFKQFNNIKGLFIKIDIEGAEEIILDDLINFLKYNKALVYLSIHIPFLQSKESFFDRLLELPIINEDYKKCLEKRTKVSELREDNFFEILIDNRRE